MHAYLMREVFQRPWEDKSTAWVRRVLDESTSRVRQPLILNWFRARGAVSSGAVEGLNKVKLRRRQSYGFWTSEVAKMALLHNLVRFPEPERTHSFC